MHVGSSKARSSWAATSKSCDQAGSLDVSSRRQQWGQFPSKGNWPLTGTGLLRR